MDERIEEQNEIIAKLQEIIGTVENLNTESWDQESVAFIHELVDRVFSNKCSINEAMNMIGTFRERVHEGDCKNAHIMMNDNSSRLNRPIY